MKLATRRNDTPEGELLIVKRDLTGAVSVTDIVPTLQMALDNWNYYFPRLKDRYDELKEGSIAYFVFNQQECESPLPKTAHWIGTSSYLAGYDMQRKILGLPKTSTVRCLPIIQHYLAETFAGPHDPIYLLNEDWNFDFKAEIAVVIADVPRNIAASDAGQYVRLIMLANDVSLKGVLPDKVVSSYQLQIKRTGTFSPVAITPDELGTDWDGDKVCLPLLSYLNGALFGYPNAGRDMLFDFSTLINHAAKEDSLRAGTIISSGSVSNQDIAQGVSCLAEKRMLEKMQYGEAKTPFLKFGDKVQIEMLDSNLNDLFGSIRQEIKRFNPSKYYEQLN